MLRRTLVWLRNAKDAVVEISLRIFASVAAALLLFLVFVFADQTHEILLKTVANLDPPGGGLPVWPIVEAVFALLCLTLACLSIWYSGRWLLLQTWPIDPDDPPIEAFVVRWLPRTLGVLPAAGAAIGFVRTAGLDEAAGYQPLAYGGAVAAALVGLGVLVYTFLRRRRPQLGFISGSRYDRDREGVFDGLIVVAIIAVLALTLLFVFVPVTPAQTIGPIALICLYATGLTIIPTWLTRMSVEHAVPYVGGLVLLAVLLSYFGLSDNHWIRTADTPGQVRSFEDSYRDWAGQRGDGPVYVVAAQGGGLYAAYHAAMTLARLEEERPGFTRNVFAVSGVSGGSVGAGIYAGVAEALCRENAEGGHVEAVRSILQNDFLSPVLAKLFFTDFTASFLPSTDEVQWLGRTDRARGLEGALDEAFRDWTAEHEAAADFLGRNVYDVWRPDGCAPALAFNVTDVSSGARVVISPFTDFGRAPGTGGRHWAKVAWGVPDAAPPLVTAMTLSARFPAVTPAGTAWIAPEGGSAGATDRAKARFVDGGYYENSGVETALDLIRAIQRVDRERPVLLVVLQFAAERVPDRRFAFGDLLSPIRTFLNTRPARGQAAKLNAAREIGERDLDGIVVVPLDNEAAEFTLGWFLNRRTFDQIECDLNIREACERIGRSVTEPEPDAGPPTICPLFDRISGRVNCLIAPRQRP